MRTFNCVAALATLLPLAGAGSALAQSPTLERIEAAGTINIGHREASVPFSYLGADQKPIGFSMDLCAKIVERVKSEMGASELAVNLVPVNSSNRIPLIQSGTVDLECGSTVNNPERAQQVGFSVAIFMTAPTWLTRSTDAVTDSQGLAGKTIVVTQGSNAVGFAQRLNAENGLNLNIIQAKDHAESFLTMTSGRAAAFLEDDILLAGLRANAPDPESLTLVPSGFAATPYGLMFARDDAQFKALVDGVLTEEMASGEFARSYDTWFMQPIPPQDRSLDFPIGDALQARIDQPSDAND